MSRSFWAPGRVNLIGEYTDLAGGLVLPAALDLTLSHKGNEGRGHVARDSAEVELLVVAHPQGSRPRVNKMTPSEVTSDWPKEGSPGRCRQEG